MQLLTRLNGRSLEDIRSVGVLEALKGRSIHDFLPAYLKFEDPTHGQCNAHHLRELTYVEEELGQGWAGDMSALLLEAKELKDDEAAGGKKVDPGSFRKILGEYRSILAAGLAINPVPEHVPGRRGRVDKGKALNLLERFATYEGEVMAYLIHGVPFDNNEAERALRMMKTR